MQKKQEHKSALQPDNQPLLQQGLTNVLSKLVSMHNTTQRNLRYWKITLHCRANWQRKYVFRVRLVLSTQIMETETRQACKKFCNEQFSLNFNEHENVIATL